MNSSKFLESCMEYGYEPEKVKQIFRDSMEDAIDILCLKMMSKPPLPPPPQYKSVEKLIIPTDLNIKYEDHSYYNTWRLRHELFNCDKEIKIDKVEWINEGIEITLILDEFNSLTIGILDSDCNTVSFNCISMDIRSTEVLGKIKEGLNNDILYVPLLSKSVYPDSIEKAFECGEFSQFGYSEYLLDELYDRLIDKHIYGLSKHLNEEGKYKNLEIWTNFGKGDLLRVVDTRTNRGCFMSIDDIYSKIVSSLNDKYINLN